MIRVVGPKIDDFYLHSLDTGKSLDWDPAE